VWIDKVYYSHECQDDCASYKYVKSNWWNWMREKIHWFFCFWSFLKLFQMWRKKNCFVLEFMRWFIRYFKLLVELNAIALWRSSKRLFCARFPNSIQWWWLLNCDIQHKSVENAVTARFISVLTMRLCACDILIMVQKNSWGEENAKMKWKRREMKIRERCVFCWKIDKMLFFFRGWNFETENSLCLGMFSWKTFLEVYEMIFCLFLQSMW
jgi:hypothetical protein